jgi:hypothetical protein
VTPYLGAVVLVNVDAAHNNGSPVAPALVTHVGGDGSVNVRVLYDGPPSHLHPLGERHRPEWLTGVAFHDTTDPAVANRHGLYGAFWPAAPAQAAASDIEERIMALQDEINTAAATLVTATNTISQVAADLGTVKSDIAAALASFQADNPAADTSGLNAAVAGIAGPLAALQAADTALGAAVPAPAAPAEPAPAEPAAPAETVSAGDTGSAA